MFVHLIRLWKNWFESLNFKTYLKLTWSCDFLLEGHSSVFVITFCLPAFLIVHLLKQSNIHSCKWDSECFKRQWILSIGEGMLSFALRLCQAHRSMSKHGDRLCGGGGWRRMRESEKGWAKDGHCCLSTPMDIHPSCSENTHTHTLTLGL